MLSIRTPRVRATGFGLIELMVALVVGLIVVGAVLAFVVSIMRSNRQTLQATRLTQELRATLAVVASDLRRARSVDDPLTVAVTTNDYANVDTTIAQCIRYGYFDDVDDDGDENPDDDNFHAIHLLNGQLMRVSASTYDAATCSGGMKLGSDQVEITAIDFYSPPIASPNPAADARRFIVTITGHLKAGDSEVSNLSRSMSQEVFVRSVGVGI